MPPGGRVLRPGRTGALPLGAGGGACKTKTGVVGVPTQGVQSGQLVVSYLLNMRPTTTTSVRWRGGLSVSPLRRKDGGAIGKSFTLGCMVSPP